MLAHIRKWGNSPSVRIPASVMAAAGLRVDSKVDVRADDEGRIIIEPVPESDASLTAALGATLGEWASAEDDAAWAGL